MSEYLYKVFQALTNAEKSGVKEVLAVYDRELQQWANEPTHLADIYYVLEEKAYRDYTDDPIIDELSCVYAALLDTFDYRVPYSDEDHHQLFLQEYESVCDVDLNHLSVRRRENGKQAF